ncbi:MAG: hypothetical protein ABI847_20285 [Anaerolineales bacterium]
MPRAPRRPFGFSGWRWELLAAAAGRTLEIGCGQGRNFEHYPAGAHVTAFDIDPARLAVRAQDLLAPLWLWTTGGCHLTRDTETTVRQSGFDLEQLKIGWGGALKLMVARPR